jgi:hypothetical protein
VNNILLLFIDLIRLRRGPQDLPSSRNLLVTSALFLLIIAVLGDHLHDNVIDSLLLSITQIAVLTVTVSIILSLHNKAERSVQTLTAFYGTSALIQLVVWPFRTWLLALGDDAQQQLPLPLIIVVMLAIWAFIVMVHIFKNALDAGTGKAIMISVLTQVVVGLSILTLFTDLQQGMPQ